jgi:micrococcal nuclease
VVVLLVGFVVRSWNRNEKQLAPQKDHKPPPSAQQTAEPASPSNSPTKTSSKGRPKAKSPESGLLTEGEYDIRRVVDGDTLLLTNNARVRLLGIDTPEVFEPDGSGQRKKTPEPWGAESSAFAKQFLQSGRVRLEFDKERQDKFGRYLAYVWVGDKMLNEELLRQGLARHTPWFPYSEAMKQRFARVQKEAQRKQLRRWSK